MDLSGGIYKDTVLCAKNSPIRLTGQVVLFEGAKLTLRAGSRIEAANGAQIEIRNGWLRAAGTADAPVVFTSSAAAPSRGSWVGLVVDQTVQGGLDIDHAVFEYASTAIYEKCCGGGAAPRSIRNSIFRHNTVGLGGYTGGTLYVDDSVFEDNGIGARDADKVFRRTIFRNNDIAVAGERMRIEDSTVTGNGTGLEMGNGCIVARTLIAKNDVGLINFSGQPAYELHELTIASNRLGVVATNTMPVSNSNLCGNTAFDFESRRAASSPMTKNHWCTTDENAIAAQIFDGHDNVSVGLVSFAQLLAAPAAGAPAIPAP